MSKEKAFWYDHKPNDNNDGYIYGINYIEDGEIIDCQWFKTIKERNNKMKEEGNT
jgi:hypothetical protein